MRWVRGAVSIMVATWLCAACFPPALPPKDTNDGEVTEETSSPEDTAAAEDTAPPETTDTEVGEVDTHDTIEVNTVPAECAIDAECDPIDRCTGAGRCVEGRCEITPHPGCATPTNPCLVATCEPSTGACGTEAAPTDTVCDDGDACTHSDRCEAGQCAGAPVVCEADACKLGLACDPRDGVCRGDNAPTGTTCTTDEDEAGSCFAGACEELPTMTVGDGHACGFFDGGKVRCWGLNGAGQLGYGHTESIGGAGQTTVRDAGWVDVPPVERVVATRANTCFIVGGELRCVGSTANGVLGLENVAGILEPDVHPGSTPDTIPRLLPPLPPVGAHVRHVSISSFYGCAVTSTGGVRCWCPMDAKLCGRGDGLKVGFDVTIAEAGEVVVGTPGDTFEAVAIQATINSTCALSSAGRIRCWGDARLAGIETDEFVGDDEPASARPIVNPTWIAKQLVSSPWDRVCALTTTGLAYCWGFGSYGALGNNATAHQQTPVMVPAFGIRQLAMGVGHTCALFNDDSVRCWGLNHVGQLGRGNTTTYGDDPARPLTAGSPVALGGPVHSIAAGGSVSCAVLKNGEIRCWGAGGYLGNGSDEHVGDDPGEMPPPRVIWR